MVTIVINFSEHTSPSPTIFNSSLQSPPSSLLSKLGTHFIGHNQFAKESSDSSARWPSNSFQNEKLWLKIWLSSELPFTGSRTSRFNRLKFSIWECLFEIHCRWNVLNPVIGEGNPLVWRKANKPKNGRWPTHQNAHSGCLKLQD